MKGIVRTKRPMKLRNWLCAGMLVTATTAAAQALFCYHLVNPSKCGVEYAPVPDECISVTCQSKLDCSLMTLDKEGTWGCPTMGCFCVAYQIFDGEHAAPDAYLAACEAVGGGGSTSTVACYARGIEEPLRDHHARVGSRSGSQLVSARSFSRLEALEDRVDQRGVSRA